VLLVTAIVVPIVVGHQSVTLTDIVFYTTLWGSAATAWAVQGGLAGRLSLGHAAYFGTGAYATVVAGEQSGLSPWALLSLAVVLAVGIGVLIELVTARLEGIYYALATFAFAQILWLIARGWTSVTGGTAGLSLPIPKSNFLKSGQFLEPAHYTILSTLLLAITVAVYYLYGRSRRGYYVRALRDSYKAAIASGIPTLSSRASAAGISAGLTACTGFLFATYIAFVDPDSTYSFQVSTLIILPAIIGGSTIFLGPTIGALLLIPFRQWLLSTGLSELNGLDWIVYGMALIISVLFLPEGLAVAFKRLLARLTERIGPNR